MTIDPLKIFYVLLSAFALRMAGLWDSLPVLLFAAPLIVVGALIIGFVIYELVSAVMSD